MHKSYVQLSEPRSRLGTFLTPKKIVSCPFPVTGQSLNSNCCCDFCLHISFDFVFEIHTNGIIYMGRNHRGSVSSSQMSAVAGVIQKLSWVGRPRWLTRRLAAVVSGECSAELLIGVLSHGLFNAALLGYLDFLCGPRVSSLRDRSSVFFSHLASEIMQRYLCCILVITGNLRRPI